MKFIRIFLWFLVLTMTLHGYLHADEYGTAISFMGGISLSMSIWKESMLTSVQALWSAPSYVPLPRAFVLAAIRETVRHPGLHVLPSLRRGLSEQRERWASFRDMEVRWMLRHADLIGAVEAEGHYLWEHWAHEKELALSIIISNTRLHCSFIPSTQCAMRRQHIAKAESLLRNATKAVSAWNRILHMDTTVGLLDWWNDINAEEHLDNYVNTFHLRLRELHDIQWPSDMRLRSLHNERIHIANRVIDAWLQRLVESLLERDIWAACLEHVSRKESRIHSLMVASGIQDMTNAHERTLNASLRATDNLRVVRDWFAEAYGYAWWMGDDIPPIVRRCSTHTVGDCTRIGPTEIIALSAQYDERIRIIEDWTRRFFIGLWNALPALGLLFIMEIIVLIVPQQRIYTHIEDQRPYYEPNTIVQETA